MDASCIFPQGVLAAVTLVGGGAGDGGAGASAGYEAGIPLCLVSITALLGVGLTPTCWSRSPELALFLLCVLFPLPTPGPLP